MPQSLAHAFSAQPRLVLGQIRVESKTNATPALLELFDLKDRIFTADAMHAQMATAATTRCR